MGTSQSSSGSPSGVPMVPPWVPEAPDGDPDAENQPEDDGTSEQQPDVPVPTAPSRRFYPARLNLGKFARSGSTADMRKGVGHYVKKGLGGARTATRRFGGTARTAGSLYGVLSAAAAGQAASPGSPFDPALLEGRSAEEVLDVLVETVRPIDGTQDTEATRFAINDALSELLAQYPEANLLDLSEEQRLFTIERYIAFDVFIRFDLDVGQHLRDSAPGVTVELARLREVKAYIRETVAATFRRIRDSAQSLNQAKIVGITRETLNDAFEVFEGYLT